MSCEIQLTDKVLNRSHPSVVKLNLISKVLKNIAFFHFCTVILNLGLSSIYYKHFEYPPLIV